MVKRGAGSSSPEIPSTGKKRRDDETEITDSPLEFVAADGQMLAVKESDSPTIEDPEEKPSTSNSATRKNPRRRRPRKGRSRRRRGATSANDSDTEQFKSRFLKRSENIDRGRRSKTAKLESERGPVVKQKPGKVTGGDQLDEATCTYDVINPSTYDKMFLRLEESYFNKAPKPEGACLDNTPWICCFCQRGPCVDDFGDLFGPYYVKLTPPGFWPPFMERRKEDKASKATAATQSGSEVNADLWFHGNCVYWAPGILLRGCGMTGLDEYLPSYWQKKCVGCQKLGASIACAAKGCGQTFHYPCAVSAGMLFKESTQSAYCESHRKLAERRK